MSLDEETLIVFWDLVTNWKWNDTRLISLQPGERYRDHRTSYQEDPRFLSYWDIGSWQNKVGNVGMTPDVCDPEQHCNWQERGWIRHHPRRWRPCLMEGRRTPWVSSYCSHGSSIPDYSCVQCNSRTCVQFYWPHTLRPTQISAQRYTRDDHVGQGLLSSLIGWW